MDNIINSVKSLVTTYGFGAATVIVLTILIVNLVKRPIVRRATELARKNGLDKAIVTKNLSLLPIAVSFVLTLGWQVAAAGFDFGAIDWADLVASAVMYAAISVATYETVKVQLRAYATRVNAEQTDGTGPSAPAAAENGSGASEAAERADAFDAPDPDATE